VAEENFVQTSEIFNLKTNRNNLVYQNTNLDYVKGSLDANKIAVINTYHGRFIGPKCFKLESKRYNREKLRKQANKKGIIFYMWEPLCLYSDNPNKELDLSFYKEFSDKLDSIYAIEIDDVIEYCKKNKLINYEIHVCDADYKGLLKKSYPNTKIIYNDIFLDSIKWGADKEMNVLKKRFVCPNARYTPHRHLIMCYLADKEGTYSWHFNCDDNMLDDIIWYDKNSMNYNTLIKGNQLLNKKNFSIDADIFPIKVHNINDYESTDTIVNPLDNRSFYKEAFCAVVNETRFAQPLANYSEKTLAPISSGIPFILVAPPYTLKLLKSHGYKTFSEWWDESYDLEENASKRLDIIFSVIDYINNLSQEEVITMYKEMKEVLKFNQSVFDSKHL